ncbi:hypothetical protein BU17DRAFT_102782 [Hysterangium stoloniferum]|nr:hypothetical protein BU17DRAFT_102782 [Hysterangium stoloniferum]
MLCLANSTPHTLTLTLPPPRWTVKGSIIMDTDKKSMQRRCIVASGEVHHLICPHTTVLGTVRLQDELMNSPDPVPRPKSSPPDFPESEYQELPPPKVTPSTRSPTDGHPRRPYQDEAESDGSSTSMHNPKNQRQYEAHGDSSHVSNCPSSGAGTSSGCRRSKCFKQKSLMPQPHCEGKRKARQDKAFNHRGEPPTRLDKKPVNGFLSILPTRLLSISHVPHV